MKGFLKIVACNEQKISDFLTQAQGKRAKNDIFYTSDLFIFVNQIKRLKERARLTWEDLDGLAVHWTRGTVKPKSYKWRSRQYFIDIFCKNKTFYIDTCGWNVLYPGQNVDKTRFSWLSNSARAKIEDTFLSMYI